MTKDIILVVVTTQTREDRDQLIILVTLTTEEREYHKSPRRSIILEVLIGDFEKNIEYYYKAAQLHESFYFANVAC